MNIPIYSNVKHFIQRPMHNTTISVSNKKGPQPLKIKEGPLKS